MEAKIDVWQHVKTDCFVFYKLAGTFDGRPFCATVGIEIDGRDAEYEYHWGENLDPEVNYDGWNALLVAFEDAEGFYEDMEKRTAEYYDAV